MTRFVALILAYIFLFLAILGVFLPGLPTVPFLLLTAWFAARGSDRLHRWLYSHPHFGKILIDWEQNRAVSRSSKIVAIIMLIASWIVMYYQLNNIWVMLVISLLFVVIATFLITRPVPEGKTCEKTKL